MAEERRLWRRVWGGASAVIGRTRPTGWIDLLVLLGVAGLIFGVIDLAQRWTGEHQAAVTIELSPWYLPQYTFLSLSRGLLAYLLSLGFTLVYGYWAAKDHVAERVLIPVLDILQSIPVLGFLPALVIGLAALFPRSNIGVEMASVIMIFTGQAWNMTFSFYHSVRSVPQEQNEVATLFRFSWWQRFKWVELPSSTVGLVWNSMMSMAGGWFFLTACEDFNLKGSDFKADFRLPGIGSYMQEAIYAERVDAMIWAIVAMVVMIVALDQFLWRPVVVWAQKFRVEEGGEQDVATSWFLNWLRRSQILSSLFRLVHRWQLRRESRSHKPVAESEAPASAAAPVNWVPGFSFVAFLFLLGILFYAVYRLTLLLQPLYWQDWLRTFGAAGLTLGRVLLSTFLGTLWAVPAGIAIGLSPRLSRILQPVVQVVASFPAPMLYPLVIAALALAGVPFGWSSMVLMLMGTQWYILFNVIAGAMAIPADLREAARSYRLSTWQRFRVLYLPGVFPHLVTGWVTAWGGAWNASILAEYADLPPRTLVTFGLGSQIHEAAENLRYDQLALSILVMAFIVVIFNKAVWKTLYRLAERRYSLNK
jgi:NitT/TauT family transport system permease protein